MGTFRNTIPQCENAMKSSIDWVRFLSNVQPQVDTLKGDINAIADVHVQFYEFYIKLASKYDILALDRQQQAYLKSCIKFLQNETLTKEDISDSRSNLELMINSIEDIYEGLGNDRQWFAKLRKLVLVEYEPVITCNEPLPGLALFHQLKNILVDPSDPPPSTAVGNDGGVEMYQSPDSPNTDNDLQFEESITTSNIESIDEYILGDKGFNYISEDIQAFTNNAMNQRMISIMPDAIPMSTTKYSILDSLLAKLQVNFPIWNFSRDQIDLLDSNNVIVNMEIYKGTKSVIDAILQNSPDPIKVGPFDVFCHNNMFAYKCLVNNCENICLTTSVEYLKTHVKFNHCISELDWNCSACDLISIHSISQKSLDGALDHLDTHHSAKTTQSQSKEKLLEMIKDINDDIQNGSKCPEIKFETIDRLENTDLYTCPVSGCDFSTNLLSLAFGHFLSIPKESLSLLKCAYCSFRAASVHSYCEHIHKIHGNAKYKCGYCCYRSVSKTNTVFHQRDTHGGEPHKIFELESPAIKEPLYECRAQDTLKAFKCKMPCNFSTMIGQKFTNHLLEHSGNPVDCYYCDQFTSVDMNDLSDHLLIHGVGEYNCMYCTEAFNFILKAEQHLHTKHASQYPFLIICQEYDKRSINFKGSYNKMQKLEVDEESIAILSLESNLDVKSIKPIFQSGTIVIDDVDHCKGQLNHFMKCKHTDIPTMEDKEQTSIISTVGLLPVLESPEVVAQVDLTDLEEEVKPRIRVKTVEELESTNNFMSALSAIPEPPIINFETFNLSSLEGVHLVTPEEISREYAKGTIKEVVFANLQEKPSESSSSLSSTSAVRIKKEPHNNDTTTEETPTPESSIASVSNDNNSIEKMPLPVQLSSVKREVIEEEERTVVTPVITVCQSLEVATGAPHVPLSTQQTETNEIEQTAENNSTTTTDLIRRPGECKPHIPSLVVPIASIDATVPERSSHFEVPILSATTIEDVPIDFAPEPLPQQSTTTDIKPKIRYKNKPNFDTTIIIDDSEDEDNDFTTSPMTSFKHEKDQTSIVQPSSSPQITVNKPTKSLIISEVTSLADFPSIITPTSTCLTTSTPKVANTEIPRFSTNTMPFVTRYKCPKCDFKSTTETITRNHILTHRVHSKNTSRKKAADKPKGDVSIVGISCPYCEQGSVYEGIAAYQKHCTKEHSKLKERKCFIIFPDNVTNHPDHLFACHICYLLYRDAATIRVHMFASHQQVLLNWDRIGAMSILRKRVCPLYNCMEEFLDKTLYEKHVDSHKQLFACKTCTYICDTAEAFNYFHTTTVHPDDRLTHFMYQPSQADLNTEHRFPGPLYIISQVILNAPNKTAFAK